MNNNEKLAKYDSYNESNSSDVETMSANDWINTLLKHHSKDKSDTDITENTDVTDLTDLTDIPSIAAWISSQNFEKRERTHSSTVLNEYTINNLNFAITNNSKNEIKRKDVNFLSNLALYTCILFPITGIPAIIFTQKMKKHYYQSNYVKARRYRNIGKTFTFLNLLLNSVTLMLLMVYMNYI